MKSLAKAVHTAANSSGKAFDKMVEKLHAGYRAKMALHGPHLFIVDSGLAYPAYIGAFSQELKAEHNCRACASFIERAGRLAFVSADGEIIPAFWDASLITGQYKKPVAALETVIRKGTIETQFFTNEAVLGTPTSDGWSHFYLHHGSEEAMNLGLLKPSQHQALRREAFKNLNRSLAEYNITRVDQVLHLIRSEQLPNGHVIKSVTEWFRKIYVDQARDDVKRSNRATIVWRHIAQVPADWCAVRGGLLGSLLDDLKDPEKELEDCIRIYAINSDPKNYMRPTAAPTEGNINVAEKLISDLNLESALERRWASIDDVKALWLPATDVPAAEPKGTFGHLRTAQKATRKQAVTPGVTTMTFTKFVRNVLQNAVSIELRTPSGNAKYVGVCAPVHADAGMLLQWDRADERNQVNFYVYDDGGSAARQWGLRPDSWVNVTGVVYAPWMWRDVEAFEKFQRAAIFSLEGAQDTEQGGLALFPQVLRSELHAVRSTIEAFSENGQLAPLPEGAVGASGLMVASQVKLDVRLRVTTDIGIAEYRLDRWD